MERGNLILGRHKGEQITLLVHGEEITVTVVSGTHVRLGIEASEACQIVRTELFNEETEMEGVA